MAGAYLTGAVLKDGVRHPAGTKVSELDLSDAEKDRLERLDLTGSKKDADSADADGEADATSSAGK